MSVFPHDSSKRFKARITKPGTLKHRRRACDFLRSRKVIPYISVAWLERGYRQGLRSLNAGCYFSTFLMSCTSEYVGEGQNIRESHRKGGKFFDGLGKIHQTCCVITAYWCKYKVPVKTKKIKKKFARTIHLSVKIKRRLERVSVCDEESTSNTYINVLLASKTISDIS